MLEGGKSGGCDYGRSENSGNFGCEQRAGEIGKVRSVWGGAEGGWSTGRGGSWPQENDTAHEIGKWGCSLWDGEDQTQARVCGV